MFKIVLIIFLTLNLFAENSWEDNVPAADKYDWVQTQSGEWLKGEIKGMYGRTLAFDSKEFDLQNIDWIDIKRLISHSLVSLNIEGRGVLTGKLNMHDGFIFLSMEDETLEIKEDQIISMTSGADTESSYWSGEFSLGLTFSSGNTDKKEYAAKFNTKRQTANTRYKINYIGNYSQTQDIETENNQRLSSSVDIFQTRRFFWRPAFVEIYKDTFQNIEKKATYGLGAGYDIYANPRTNWTVFAGPAYQITTFDAVPEGNDKTEETPAIILTSDYDFEITSSLDFIAKYQAYFVNKKSGTYVQHALITLESELINDFDLDLTVIWDRVQDPAENEDGTLPERDDYKTILSVAYSF